MAIATPSRPMRVAYWVAGLLSDPASYLLCLCVLITVTSKTQMALQLDSGQPWFDLLRPATSDVAVYFSAAALLVAARKNAILQWLGTSLAACLSLFGALNAVYLHLSGEQGDLDSLQDLWRRREDAWMVLRERLNSASELAIAGMVLAALWALPTYLQRWLSVHEQTPSASHLARRCAVLALGGLLLHLALPSPTNIPERRLAANAAIQVARAVIESADEGTFEKFQPSQLVEKTAIKTAKSEFGRPNLLFIVLESTRFDYTSLAGAQAKADTPNIAALAQEGLVAEHMRAVLPHTSKSLFSIACGRMPTMQKSGVEYARNSRVQCLPRIANDLGYRTAFIQSSFGTFEQRPRLVSNLGFREFMAWEDIQGTKLGYLASDDRSLVHPLLDWIDRGQPDRSPFFAMVLTSATHHPYRLSSTLERRAQASNKAYLTKEQRYARLVENADAAIGEIVEGLRVRNLLDQTIIVILGDHGEGFGEHIALGHDNIFYEEGLHVPFVMRGPGIEPKRISANASLVDVTATVLDLWHLPTSSAIESHSLLDDSLDQSQPRYFGCFNPLQCRGYVRGSHKIVKDPGSQDVWMYDLAADPLESVPLEVPPAELMQVENLDKRFAELRSSEWNHVREEVKHYAKWYCPKSSAYCFHEHAFARKHRMKRKDISRKTKRSKKRAKTLPIAPACWPDASIMQPRQSARQDSANSWEIVSPADPLMCENP